MRAQALAMDQASRRESTVLSESARSISHHGFGAPGFGSPLVDGRLGHFEGSTHEAKSSIMVAV